MGKFRLTNEIIDQRLCNKKVKRLTNYIDNKTLLQFKCLVENCDHIWAARFYDILKSKENGCPKCAGLMKLNDIIVDQKLVENNRNIKRLENYGGNKFKIKWQCLVENCNYIWKAAPNDVLNSNTGCPECAGTLLLSNEIVDRRLLGRSLKRIDNYIDINTRIKFECLIPDCHHIWHARPNNILYSMSGCPECASVKLTNMIVDEKLTNRSIKRLEDYIDNKYPIKWQCLVEDCKYEWSAASTDILNHMTGCPKCAKSLKLDNEMVDKRLIGRNIKRLGECIGGEFHIKWQCLIPNCNYIWEATPTNILNYSKTGCPNCAHGKNERIVYEIMKQNNIIFNRHHDIRKTIKNENRLLYVDFYIPNQNIIIEYNGVQHYQPVRFGGISQERAQINFIKQQERDKYLQQFCINNNIQLIWVDGRKYINDKLKTHIIEHIIPILTTASSNIL